MPKMKVYLFVDGSKRNCRMATKESHQLSNSNQAFLIYQDDNGIARVNVRFEGEDVWLTQEQRMPQGQVSDI